MTAPAVRAAAAAVALVAVGGALAACGDDSTEPAAVLAGRYALVSANGEALPFTFEQNSNGTFRELVSGWAEFRSRSRVLDSKVIRMVDPRPDPPRTETNVQEVVATYVVSANSVLLTFPAQLGAVAWTDTGTVSEDRTHVLVRARMPSGPGYVYLDLLYGKVP